MDIEAPARKVASREPLSRRLAHVRSYSPIAAATTTWTTIRKKPQT
jgi:hypothetical protein